MALPVMTPEQRDAAREKAGRARRERADLKAALKAGTLTVADVIRAADGSDAAGKMKVSALVGALPCMGKVKTAHLMGRLGIAENRRVRALSARQRAALEAAFAPLDA